MELRSPGSFVNTLTSITMGRCSQEKIKKKKKRNCPGYFTELQLMVWVQLKNSLTVEYSFKTNNQRSTLIWIYDIRYGPIFESNKSKGKLLYVVGIPNIIQPYAKPHKNLTKYLNINVP